MRTAMRIAAGCLMVWQAGVACAGESAYGPGEGESAKQAAMAAMQKAGSPGEAHKALEPFAGTWTYTAQWWTGPDEQPQTMTGTTVNTLIYGGRFLKQEFKGSDTQDGQPPFEGLGFTGYDNLRQEYQTVWFDNMATGMMVGAGKFDDATKSLTDQGEFSCPLTMETHRKFRSVFTVTDPTHTIYENYMSRPEGGEYKAMEIRYTKAQ